MPRNGEESIDEYGRNATQRRIDELDPLDADELADIEWDTPEPGEDDEDLDWDEE